MATKHPGHRGERATHAPTPVEPERQTDAPVLAKGTRKDLSKQATSASLREDLSTIAHDLKNPLGVIVLEVQALESRMGRAVPAVHHGLERIAQNAMFVERLLSGLLDLVASEEGELELRVERVDLPILLRETLDRAVASMDRPRVMLDIRDNLAVTGDSMRLERVVANLLDNALKYGSREAPVTVRLDRRAGSACISVIDSGPGLQPHEIETCFERFHRGDRGSPGHGLGLYIARRIVEAHKGRIGVQTAPGKGARFYVLLPLDAAR
jgi:signal transduction histidine kinase